MDVLPDETVWEVFFAAKQSRADSPVGPICAALPLFIYSEDRLFSYSEKLRLPDLNREGGLAAVSLTQAGENLLPRLTLTGGMDELKARREGLFYATKCLFRFGKISAQPGLEKLVQLFDFSSAPIPEVILLMHGCV